MKKTLVLCMTLLTMPAFGITSPTFAAFQEAKLKEIAEKAGDARESILYNACIYENFDSHPYVVTYSEVFKRTVCTCFADKVTSFERTADKATVEAYFKSTVKYQALQNKKYVECVNENEKLRWL